MTTDQRNKQHCVGCGRIVVLKAFEALCVECQWGETNASYGRRVLRRPSMLGTDPGPVPAL